MEMIQQRGRNDGAGKERTIVEGMSLNRRPRLRIWIEAQKKDVCTHACSVLQSCLTLVAPGSVAHQVPLSMAFSRQEYWSGLPFPTAGDLALGIKPTSPALAGRFFTTEPLGTLIAS